MYEQIGTLRYITFILVVLYPNHFWIKKSTCILSFTEQQERDSMEFQANRSHKVEHRLWVSKRQKENYSIFSAIRRISLSSLVSYSQCASH
jgi:hypothetical protein